MKHQPRKLKIAIDNKPYTSNLAPEPIDDFDGHCSACGSENYTELMTIVQRGFELDDCITLMTCADCFETFHYCYQVDSELTIAPAFTSLTNNIQ